MEALVLETRGVLDVYERCVIQSAVKWHVHGDLCSRWLRLADADIGHSDRLAYTSSEANRRATAKKCLDNHRKFDSARARS